MNIENFAGGPANQRMRATNTSFRDPTSAVNIARDDSDLRRQLDKECKKNIHLEKLLDRTLQELKRYQDRFGHALEKKEYDDDSIHED